MSSSAVGVRTVVDAGNGDEVAGVVEAVQDPVGTAAGTPLPREVIAHGLPTLRGFSVSGP